MKLNRIPHIYHNTVYAKKIFEIIEDKHIRIKDVFEEIGNFNDLTKCKGALLDLLGQNFKIFRNGRNDIEYRKVILFEIVSLCFIGNVEEMIKILSMYFNENINKFSITELSGKIRIVIPNSVSKVETLNLLRKIKGAGIGLNVDFEVYIEDYLLSELESMKLDKIEKIKLARG